MKGIYSFFVIFVSINTYFIYYWMNKSLCINYYDKLYLGLFYLVSFLYVGYIYYYYVRYNSESMVEIMKNTMVIDLTNNRSYELNSEKAIYWIEDIVQNSQYDIYYNNFNTNGLVDILDNKIIIPYNCNTESNANTVIKYRVINNGILSEIYSHPIKC